MLGLKCLRNDDSHTAGIVQEEFGNPFCIHCSISSLETYSTLEELQLLPRVNIKHLFSDLTAIFGKVLNRLPFVLLSTASLVRKLCQSSCFSSVHALVCVFVFAVCKNNGNTRSISIGMFPLS